jgi:hypothetical protein
MFKDDKCFPLALILGLAFAELIFYLIKLGLAFAALIFYLLN